MSCMYPKEYEKDNYIIQEGEIGHALFVISGILNQTVFVGTMLFNDLNFDVHQGIIPVISIFLSCSLTFL